MAWLKVSFSPVSVSTATFPGFGLFFFVTLATARFAGRETRALFAEAFFAVGFFICRHSTSFDRAAQVCCGVTATVQCSRLFPKNRLRSQRIQIGHETALRRGRNRVTSRNLAVRPENGNLGLRGHYSCVQHGLH